MHFSEDDLREALKRKDPGEGFTQRVMARVNQARVNQAKQRHNAAGNKEGQRKVSFLVDASSGVGYGRGSGVAAGLRDWRLSIL